MSNWLSEWSDCDLSQWWEEIFDIGNSPVPGGAEE